VYGNDSRQTGPHDRNSKVGSIQYLLIRLIFALFAAVAEEELDGEPKSSVGSPGLRSNLLIIPFVLNPLRG
jgi:hypothetical protein